MTRKSSPIEKYQDSQRDRGQLFSLSKTIPKSRVILHDRSIYLGLFSSHKMDLDFLWTVLEEQNSAEGYVVPGKVSELLSRHNLDIERILILPKQSTKN